MRTNLGWRSPTIAEDFSEHDNADFAQEFLRRNPAYQREYSDAQDRIEADALDSNNEMEGLARRWGMTFPMSAGCRSARCARALGTVACCYNRNRRCRANRA